MSKLREIYKKLSQDNALSKLSQEERTLLIANEDHIQDMMSEMQKICKKYIDEGLEFDMNLELYSVADGSLHWRYHNNMVKF